MLIRKASESDLSRVADIYAAIHTEEEAGRARIGWQREIYPTFDTARAAWQRDDLFVLEEDGSILGAAIINQIQVDVYGDAPWEYKPAMTRSVCCIPWSSIRLPAGGDWAWLLSGTMKTMPGNTA